MKLWNYMAIMLTMMTFLFFMGFEPVGADIVLGNAGIIINATTGELITGDVANSDWVFKLIGTSGLLLVLGASATIIVGYFTKTFEWKLTLLPFFLLYVGLFFGFGLSIVSLALVEGEMWLIAIIATVFLPLTAMFVMSFVEWFGGSPSD